MDADLKVFELYDDTNPKKIDAFNGTVNSKYLVEANSEKKDNDFTWLSLMENTMQYLDNILRNPSRFIINQEEVVNVEKARRTTVETIKHLAKHTNYIQEINDNGEVKPSKILNIDKDESYTTYENRLIYTLILNMRAFIDIHKRNLNVESFNKKYKKSEYHGVAKLGSEKITIDMSLSAGFNEINKAEQKDGLSVGERIDKLEYQIKDLMNTQIYKILEKNHVAKVMPPIKKTNLILKNVNFQYAMKLWDFLQNYVDNDVSKKNKIKSTNDNDIKSMFDEMFLLNYLVVDRVSKNDSKASFKKLSKEKLTDFMINKIVEINADLSIEEVEKYIGERIYIKKASKEASLAEVEQKINGKIQSIISRIINFEFE